MLFRRQKIQLKLPTKTALCNIRDWLTDNDEMRLVGVEPCSIPQFPEFEGTIYGMQVEFDTVQYAENVINAASQI